MDPFEEAYLALVADEAWMAALEAGPFAGLPGGFREFLGALRAKFVMMARSGLWQSESSAALAATVRRQCDAHLRRHPPMEVYGYGAVILTCEGGSTSKRTVRLAAIVRSLTDDLVLGGRLVLRPGPGASFPDAVTDVDDYTAAIRVETEAAVTAEPGEEVWVEADLAGYDPCWCDGDHILGVLRHRRFRVPS